MTMKVINKTKSVGDLPDMTNTVTVENEHADLEQILAAFKVFLEGCTFSQKLVDRIVILEEEEL